MFVHPHEEFKAINLIWNILFNSKISNHDDHVAIRGKITTKRRLTPLLQFLWAIHKVYVTNFEP